MGRNILQRWSFFLLGLVLLVASCATSKPRPPLTKVAITDLSVAFLHARPGQSMYEWRSYSPALLLKIVLTNPLAVAQQVALRCQRAEDGRDLGQAQLLTLAPRSEVRQNIPLMAQQVHTYVRCRVEPRAGHLAQGSWLNVQIPAMN